MPPVVEERADAALVAVLPADGQVVRGTGFVIDERGTVLTCHHVVEGLESLLIRGPGGSSDLVSSDAIAFAPDIDLALIRAPKVRGSPLPLASTVKAPTEYWTKGFHRIGGAIRAAFPVPAVDAGRTSVTYSGDSTRYDIDDILVVSDADIDPGLSGAPLLDRQFGVVVGVVSSKLVRANEKGGFAIPISRAAGHPALAHDVAANQATVPAYGPYLNAPAARKLCAAITHSEIQNLIQLRGVDLSRRVRRSEVEDAIGQFLSADAAVLALIGPSGVGKSTEIAALAQRLRRCALLLRGSALRPDSSGLGSAVNAALVAASSGLPLPDSADMVIAGALAADSRLVVLLDALNEAQLNGLALEEWIASTRSWLRQTSAQLVVSCRSELWADVVGPVLSTAIDQGETVVASLGQFTDQEFVEAATTYGLPAGIDWPILRLPLALSLYVHREDGLFSDGDANASINKVVEGYVTEVARRLVRISPGPPLSARVMRDRLVEMAVQMRDRGTDVLDMQAFSEIFGTTEIVDSLVQEGVMSSTPTGYRFVYDDVEDWLQAQSFDLDRELTTILQGEQVSWRHVAVVASALRDTERRDGADALRILLMLLVENAETSNSRAFRVVEETLVKVANAQPYAGVLDRMVDLVTSSAMSRESGYESLEFWRSVPIPLRQRLDLLQQLIPISGDAYDWEPKHWSGLPEPEENPSRRPATFAMLAYQLVNQGPAIGIPALLPWFDDDRRLDSGTTVADVAMGILHQLSQRHPQLVWSSIIKADDPGSSLVYRLVDNYPEWLAHMVSGKHNVKATDTLVVGIAWNLRRASLPGEIAEAVRRTVADRYERGLALELQTTALAILVHGKNGSRYTRRLLQAYRKGLPGADEVFLSEGLQKGRDVVLPILIEALEHGGERRANVLAVLGYSTDTAVQTAGDHAVRNLLETASQVVDTRVCLYAEQRLYRTEVPSDDLLAVLRRIIAAPPGSGREVLAYALTDRRGLRDSKLRAQLLGELVDTPGDTRALTQVVTSLLEVLNYKPPLPGAMTMLRHVLARCDKSEADRALFLVAYKYDRADMLADLLTSGALTPLGAYTKKIKEDVEQGDQPQNVVNQIVHKEIG
jgi:hypothetical protein